MKNINKIIKKFQNPYTHMEKRSKKYEQKIRAETRLKNRMLILDTLINELPKGLYLHNNQIMFCRNLITTFNNDFKYLHRQASEEAIILAFIFYQKKLVKPRITVEEYKICNKYKLTTPIFINICCRIANYYMVHSPINIRQTTSYDHELLVKNNGL